MVIPKNKHILLINPPIEDFYQTKIRQEPLGLAYLAAVLTEAGFSVTFLDTLATEKKTTLPIPPAFQDLKRFYPPADLSPFKLFTNYFHFGFNWETIAVQIKQAQPALIGISANFSPYFNAALTVAQMCKNIFPQIPVIVGGHHVTATPIETLVHSAIDYVILGEGEYTFRTFAGYYFQNMVEKISQLPGLAWRESGVIHVNPPAPPIDSLDALPLPQHQMPPRMKMLISSRGCPQGCEFCSIKQVMGSRLRFRSVENVIQEIQYWVSQGIGHFDFEDDNLVYAPGRAKILLRQLIHHFGPRRLKFSAMNGLSADYLDIELLELLREAGFEWLNLPLVTGNPHLQQRLQRHQSREHFYQIVDLAAQFDLKVVGYLILGLPEDTIEEMLQNILELAQARLLIGPSIFYPPPGSAIYQFCLQKEYLKGGEYARLRSSAIPIETLNFTRRDLVTLFRLCRVLNFCKQLIDSARAPAGNLATWLQEQPALATRLISDTRLTPRSIGVSLLKQLLFQRQLTGLRLQEKRGNLFYYQPLEYEISTPIIEMFLNRLAVISLKGIQTKATEVIFHT